MAQKGKVKKFVQSPPKQFGIPANLRSLGQYGHEIIEQMRQEYRKRMNN